MMSPRIALLAYAYPPDHMTLTGGVATATAALLEGLRNLQDEFEVHVISTSRTIPTDVHEQHAGFWFHFLSLPRQPWLRPRLALRFARIFRELRRIHPDLVHSQGDAAEAIAAPLSGYTHVHTLHGIYKHETPLKTDWEFWASCINIPLQAYVKRNVRAFISISSYAARELGNGGKKFAIPNAVGSRFLRMPRNAAWSRTPYLLFVGLLTPRKRPIDLLLAHQVLRREFPTLQTIFCGGTEERAYVEVMHRLVARQRIEGVFFTGPASRDTIAELLAGAAVLVLPSAEENAPMAIAEAMAACVPVVASRVGGIEDMVRHGETGLLYQARDIRSLTGCLQTLLRNPALCDRMGRQARNWALETYAPQRVAEATVSVYRQLLGGPCLRQVPVMRQA
jgi:glycosyltransferase involved in cell wall biosynthesis